MSGKHGCQMACLKLSRSNCIESNSSISFFISDISSPDAFLFESAARIATDRFVNANQGFYMALPTSVLSALLHFRRKDQARLHSSIEILLTYLHYTCCCHRINACGN